MVDPTIAVAFGAAVPLLKLFSNLATRAAEDKNTYTQKLEEATGDEIFKYVLLINVAAIEGYVALTRVQAEQSFRWSKGVAVTGFVIIAIGVTIAIVTAATGTVVIEAAYLASLAGVFIEFIAGVFFFLYNRTLQQLNTVHERLSSSQQLAMSVLASSVVSDETKRDESRTEVAKLIASGSIGSP